ncbi:MAG TPA: ribokinase [Candidatus Anammoximicrobium sp.]|nr:ribokinase [Candidatus Anammoximicrobium sp.]
MSATIIVVGSSNVDFIMKVPHLPQRGETVTDATFLQTFGGKGDNQAIAAARAGGDVHFVNCVGEDHYGAAIVENLKAASVHTEFMFTAAGVASGTALVMVGDRGDNYLSVAPGANYRLTRQHIDQVRTLIGDAAMIVLQCEVLTETLEYVLELAAQRQRPILLNLAPARKVSEAGLRNVAYLVVNESEAEFLCGFPVDSLPRAAQAAESLRTRGPRAVLITLGSQGVCVACGGPPTHAPAFSVAAVDATAAGDVFCGALAVALVENRRLEQAVRFASAAAAICVTRLGAQPSIPSRQEIERFLRETGDK